jgi:hypothetical protein
MDESSAGVFLAAAKGPSAITVLLTTLLVNQVQSPANVLTLDGWHYF